MKIKCCLEGCRCVRNKLHGQACAAHAEKQYGFGFEDTRPARQIRATAIPCFVVKIRQILTAGTLDVDPQGASKMHQSEDGIV